MPPSPTSPSSPPDRCRTTRSTSRGRSPCSPPPARAGWAPPGMPRTAPVGAPPLAGWPRSRVATGSAEVRATASDVGVEVVLRYRLDDHGVLVVERRDQHLRRPDAARRRRAAGHPAAAAACRRGARPHRPLVPRALAAAPPARPRHAPAGGRRGRTGHDARCSWWPARPGSACAPARCGPCTPRGAATTSTSSSAPRGRRHHTRGARRRRAARAGRGPPRPRRDVCRPDGRLRPLHRGPRRALAPLYGSQRARPGTDAARARSCSTRGRRSTSTTDLDHLKRLADTAARDRRRALRPRRRLVRRPPRRPRRARRLGRSPPDVWPTGLGPLVDHVKGLGMEFGLWFEPEMVNLDSDLVRAHPEWVLGPVAGTAACRRGTSTCSTWRTPTRAASARGDQRADRRVRHRLHQVGPQPRPARGRAHRCRPGRDRPRACTPRPSPSTGCSTSCGPAHPGLEIESCSSGGAPGRPRRARPHRPDLDLATATTPSSGPPSSAGPACSCRRS